MKSIVDATWHFVSEIARKRNWRPCDQFQANQYKNDYGMVRFYLNDIYLPFGERLQVNKRHHQLSGFKTSFNYCSSGGGQNSAVSVVRDVQE